LSEMTKVWRVGVIIFGPGGLVTNKFRKQLIGPTPYYQQFTAKSVPQDSA